MYKVALGDEISKSYFERIEKQKHYPSDGNSNAGHSRGVSEGFLKAFLRSILELCNIVDVLCLDWIFILRLIYIILFDLEH